MARQKYFYLRTYDERGREISHINWKPIQAKHRYLEEADALDVMDEIRELVPQVCRIDLLLEDPLHEDYDEIDTWVRAEWPDEEPLPAYKGIPYDEFFPKESADDV